MKIIKLFVTQRKLRNINQLSQMLEAIENYVILPPIRLSEFEDGTIHIEDGHHRCLSYWLSGRKELNQSEYILIQKDNPDRVRFGNITNLWERIMSDEIGYTIGETCGRNGCTGKIQEKEAEGCSCHINPPCSACTAPREYCDKCDWEDEHQA